MKFKNWTITGVDTSELVLTNEELTFTMPANAVTATANYDFESYEIKVTGGTAQVNDGVASASVKAHYGEEVTITAAAPETGKRFTNGRHGASERWWLKPHTRCTLRRHRQN